MQSTLDRKVLYLMLRGARRQEAKRRKMPAPGRTLPARLTEDAWWLDAPQPQPAPRAATTTPQLTPPTILKRCPSR